VSKIYQSPELQILMILAEDVISTSDGFLGDEDYLGGDEK
jgi:hypothetical protein